MSGVVGGPGVPVFRITLEYTDNNPVNPASMKQEMLVDARAVILQKGTPLFQASYDASLKFWETAVLMGLLDSP